ncbi:hypothetical protein M0802_004164 [Mischocyttarus mexicanus]|nr:hypothetical protein M0802_004164 [Mischocyttarus mexicanus]
MEDNDRESALRVSMEEEENRKTDSKETRERSIIIVGSKSVGKTTMINRFLEKDEKPKPTIAMEYSFGRKAGKSLDLDSDKKEIIGRTLRAIAHSLGAGLYYYSSKDKILLRKTKDLLCHIGFGSILSEGKFTSYDKPLIISPGADTFSSIDLQLPYSKPSMIFDTIKQTFVVRVPQITRNEESTLEDPSNDPNFNESIIDKLKVQREEEINVLLDDMLNGRIQQIPIPDPV